MQPLAHLCIVCCLKLLISKDVVYFSYGNKSAYYSAFTAVGNRGSENKHFQRKNYYSIEQRVNNKTMWNNSKNLANHLRNFASPFLATSSGFLSQQTRNTFVLKRRWPPALHKKYGSRPILRGRNYVYDLVEDTDLRKRPDLDVILTTYVEGVGNKGDRVSMRPHAAYIKLLLPGLAVYASPENCEKFEKIEESTEEKNLFSSPYVERTMNLLSRRTLAINLSDHNPWVLEKWHVKSSFRSAGFHMENDSITLPEKPISGPDPSIEGKEFYVIVTINDKDQVKVRCRIHHLSQARLNSKFDIEFYKNPAEPIFPEDKPVLDSIPPYFEKKQTMSF